MTEKECSFDKPVRTCDYRCFACTLMHGLEKGGKGGLWATTGVPKRYKDVRIEEIPVGNQNPKAYELAKRYSSNILSTVQDTNIGLFLYSIPSKENPFGTGTGKTTTAVALLNQYVIERVRAYLRGEQELENNPALFVKVTELQNSFNAQFRGTFSQKETASIRYYNLKKAIKETEFVVMDDIATRGTRISEAFEDELYEVIDYRATQIDKGATLFTSNVDMTGISEALGERIASRISGMTVNVGFTGKDNRKDSIFN